MRPIVLLAFSLHRAPPAAHPADGWFGADKVKHFFVSAFVQSVGYSGLQAAGLSRAPALAGATLVTAAAGVGREIHDGRTKGLFSRRDLVWDALGTGTATILLTHTQR